MKYLAISLGVVAVVLGGFIGGYYIGYDDAKLDIAKKDKHIWSKRFKKEFKNIFFKENILIGVDEIELGTDANEAASLFKVIIEEIMKKNRIVITTHHKRLATLLAQNEEVEILAAIYDEKQQKPTFEFIKGTIGKSYAFETAKRYGIPLNIINKAKEEYSQDLEKLDVLIEKSAQLEFEQKQKIKELESELEDVKLLKESLYRAKEEFNETIEKEKNKLLEMLKN